MVNGYKGQLYGCGIYGTPAREVGDLGLLLEYKRARRKNIIYGGNGRRIGIKLTVDGTQVPRLSVYRTNTKTVATTTAATGLERIVYDHV